MSSKAQPVTNQTTSSSQTFQQNKAKPGTRVLTSEAIHDDIVEFKKRGGRIDVLGNTPLRTTAIATSRSTAANKKAPTPVAEAGKTAG